MKNPTRTDIERFSAFVSQENIPGGCHIWRGALSSGRYGCFSFGGRGKNVLAHRWIYEYTRGPIEPTLVIDHMCRNPRCVNPAHLRVVTQEENTLCGFSLPAINKRATHCIRGHLLEGDNVKVRPNGRRRCLACVKLTNADRHKKKSV